MSQLKILIIVILLLLPVIIYAQESPYSKSEVIKGINFDWSFHIRLAPGSDNWPVTWADDGNQYVVWGDGGGFGGTNGIGRDPGQVYNRIRVSIPWSGNQQTGMA